MYLAFEKNGDVSQIVLQTLNDSQILDSAKLLRVLFLNQTYF